MKNIQSTGVQVFKELVSEHDTDVLQLVVKNDAISGVHGDQYYRVTVYKDGNSFRQSVIPCTENGENLN